MKRIFDYDSKIQTDLYFENFHLENTPLILSACTAPNGDNKPNEDSFSIVQKDNTLWVGLFDGTTSLRALESSIDISGAKFASSFLKNHFIETETSALQSPKQELLKLNSLLFEESEKLGGKLEDTHSLPAAMATILKINLTDMVMEIAHAGDTWAIVYDKNNRSEVITEDRNKPFDDKIFSLIKNISNKKGISIREARQDESVNKSLYKMYLNRNNNQNGNGSGLINGDPNLNLYIQEKSIDLKDSKALLIGSDGLEIQGYTLTDIGYRNLLYSSYKNGGFKKLIELKRSSEDNDPDWQNIRYKHSDDATGVFIELSYVLE